MSFLILLLFISIEVSLCNNCSVLCESYPRKWCCPDGYVCYATNECYPSYSGYRGWILLLRVVVPIVILMIVIIVVAYVQHKRDPTGQLKSKSTKDTTSNSTQDHSQIFQIFMPQSLGIQV